MYLLHLLGLKIKTDFFSFLDFLWVIFHCYGNPLFKKVDLALLKRYFFNSPYKISREFLKRRGEEEIYSFGETPLKTFSQIVERAKLSDQDVVFELGCGRGRTCFWLSICKGIKAHGIDFVPEFISMANEVKDDFGVKNIEFRCEDFFKSDLSMATVIYLHGSCMSIEEVAALENLLEECPGCKKVISVSFPLEGSDWTVIDSFQARMSWGLAEVYVQERIA